MYNRHFETYLTLPSGYFKNIGVKPYSIADELLTITPDALFSGEAIVEIIKSCLPDIKDPWNLPSSDLNAILIAIKIASSGKDLDIWLKCHNCQVEDPYQIDLVKLQSHFLNINHWITPFKLNNITFYFKPCSLREFNNNNLELYKINKTINNLKSITEISQKEKISNELLISFNNLSFNQLLQNIHTLKTDSIECSDQTFISELLKNTESTIIKQLQDHVVSLRKIDQIPDLQWTCSKCGESKTIPIVLDHSELFRNKILTMNEEEIIKIIEKMDNDKKSLKTDILKMLWYMRGSISISEAFNLSESDRKIISDIIKGNFETAAKIKMPFW